MSRDVQLLRRYAQSQDPDAFAELVSRYAGLVYSASVRVTSNVEDAEDATQECFMALARNAGSIAAPLPAWLHVTATNRARNLLRSSARRKRREAAAVIRRSNEAGPTWPEIEPHVDAALLELPEDLRLPIILHYLRKMTQAEVANELGVERSTVSRRLDRGVKELRKKLQKMGVVVPVAVVAGVLAEQAAGAVPATLEASLAKMGLAGVAQTGAAPSGSGMPGAVRGTLQAKISLVAATAIVAAAGVAMYRRAMERQPEVTPVAAAAPRAARVRPAAASLDTRSPDADDSGLTVRGIVTDRSGQPVSGVIVRTDVGIFQDDYQKGEAQTRTDEEGRFELGHLPGSNRHRRYRQVFFNHPAYGLACLPRWSTGKSYGRRLHIRLAPPELVAGTVTDRAGRPVADATVSANVQVLGMQGPRSYSYIEMGTQNGLAETTDGRGRFVFRRIPRGARLNLRVEHEQFATYSMTDGQDVSRQAVQYLVRAGDIGVRVVLDPAGAIRGRLVLGGRPYGAEGVRVTAIASAHRSGSATTGEDGSFELTRLHSDTFVVYARGDTLTRSGLAATARRDVRLRPGEILTGFEVEVSEGQLVAGRVLHADSGAPVEGHEVSCSIRAAANIRFHSATTDVDGRYQLRLGVGEYLIRTYGQRKGAYHCFEKVVKVTRGSDVTDADFRIGTLAHIRGRLVDRAGEPVVGTILRPGSGVPVPTGKDGTFSLRTPTRPRLCLAFDQEHDRGLAHVLRPTVGGAELRLALQPLLTVRGRVVDTSGSPLAKARAEVRIRPQGYLFWHILDATADANGVFSVRGIPRGLSMWVAAAKAGFREATFELMAVPSDGAMDIGEVTLTPIDPGTATGLPLQAISGRIVGETGEPLARVAIDICIDRYEQDDTSDWRGRFRLEGLPAGRPVDLVLSREDRGYRVFPGIEPGAEDVELRLLPPGHGLIGKPAPELQVSDWLNSPPLSLKELRGSVVILLIGCRLVSGPPGSGNALKELAVGYRGRAVVVGVHSSQRSASQRLMPDELERYLDEHEITSPMALDLPLTDEPSSARKDRLDWVWSATEAAYNATGRPSIFLVDQKGILRCSPSRSDLHGWVRRLLAER